LFFLIQNVLRKKLRANDNKLEIVYLLNKNHWGKGLMPEILNEVNLYASSSGKKLIATVNPGNENSMKVLKKIGLIKEEWITDEEGKAFKVTLKQPDGIKIDS